MAYYKIQNITVNSKIRWYYLTTIIDLADRKIVGWSLSNDMTTENTIYKTWIMARNTRQITKNHTFHSDRGVQYASHTVRLIFNENIHITQSMSRKGNCWDNAVAESFFKTIKYECIYSYKFNHYLQAYKTINNYIKWYNNERLHSSLEYKTPLEVEIEYYNNFKIVA